MTTFKYKPEKVKYLNIVETLDEKHQQFVNIFKDKKNNLPNKIEELNNLKKKLDDLNNINLNLEYNFDKLVKEKSILKDNINKLENEINSIKNGTDEIEYYFKTGDIIIDYYTSFDREDDSNDSNNNNTENTEENKTKKVRINFGKNINSIDDLSNNKLTEINKNNQLLRKEKKPTKKRIKNVDDIVVNNNKSILSFFTTNNQDNNTESDNIEKVISNRKSLYDSYMSLIDKKYMSDKINKSSSIKICSKCNIEKTLIQSEGLYVCTKCSEVEYVIIESDQICHKDIGNEKPRTPYKKQTHLTETLNQFQAKESTEIPKKIYIGIHEELKKLKITVNDLNEMKYSKSKLLIKSILKKLRFTTYYEHIPFILSKITNKPAPSISREIEEIIKKMFKTIEPLFVKYCPNDRKNFLNYNYVFHKFFEILDMDDYADCFPLLKSRDKLKKADEVWEKICNDTNWTFTPSC